MAKEAPKANVPAVPEAAEETPKKRGKLKKIVILVVCLLIILSAGGGGAYWWFFLRVPPHTAEDAPAAPPAAGSGGGHGKEAASPKVERPAELPRSTGMVVPLPQFTVNLADAGGKRYLRLGMEVEAGSDISKELKALDAKVRDAVITLLAGKSFAEISSPEGKVLLKAEVAARLNQILGAPKVVRVYFTEFVVE
jgi:flagellar FliL protein